MNGCTIIRRGKEGIAWSGLALALCLAGGCGPQPATPSAPAKPAAGAAKANDTNAAPANSFAAYVSAFEDLLPPKGRDPFYPTSHRRDVKMEVPETAPAAPVDTIFQLKAVLLSRRHSQAVINNEIVEEGEEASIRTPSGDKIHFKCIHIGKNSVDVLIQGQAEPKRLIMQQKKN